MAVKVTDTLLDFALGTTYDSIPDYVIEQSKYVLMDSIGNTLGGIASDKGKVGIAIARRQGGRPESTVLGIGDKVSAPVAAFANAELSNGLDMDPIPHVGPIIVPAMMAVAEAEHVDGKTFLSALSIAQEICFRITSTFGTVMEKSIIKYGKNPDVFGNSNEHIIGTAIGNALLMGLGREQVGQALGIAAYLCSLPVCRDWESTMPKSMIKYVPISWIAQGSVQSAQLASEGYTSNVNTLDSEYGFPVIYCRVDGVWEPEKVINGIGNTWKMMDYDFKPYPCCRFLHSALDALYHLLARQSFDVKDVNAVDVYTSPFVAHADQYAVSNQVDAQFSGPYTIALALLGYTPGPAWQDKKALTDPAVRELMNKVTMHVAPEYAQMRASTPGAWYSRVEVSYRGEIYKEINVFAKGANVKGYRFTDADFEKKFSTSAAVLLPEHKIKKAIDLIYHLDEQPSLDELIDNLTM